jgi:dCTP deaminase
MGVLSGNMIRHKGIILPHVDRTEVEYTQFGHTFKLSHGESIAGYDVRIEFDSRGKLERCALDTGEFMLASTLEHFSMPRDVLGVVHDKSSWARKGLALQNTVIEPGWRGYLTLELTNHGNSRIVLERGMPIAQVVFYTVEGIVKPYDGKYQDQERGPQLAR